MKSRRWIAALMAFALWAALLPQIRAQAPQNLLVNPGFEEGFYFADNAPELEVANGWKPWWIEGSPEETSRGYLHRPEYKAEDRFLYGDRRIRNGRYAQKFFTSFSTHHAGFFQNAAALRGSQVTFCIWVQVWSSSQHDPDVSEGPGKVRVSVGIDPLGRSDPYYPEVIWAEPVIQYDQWLHLCVGAPAQADSVTVWTRSVVEWPVVHNDTYWDDATLVVSQPPPTPTPVPTDTPLPTDTPPPTTTPTPTPVPTDTPTPSASPTPTTVPTATPTPLPPAVTIHVVQPGETPLAVALAHGTTVWHIALANDLRFPYLLHAGADLVIP